MAEIGRGAGALLEAGMPALALVEGWESSLFLLASFFPLNFCFMLFNIVAGLTHCWYTCLASAPHRPYTPGGRSMRSRALPKWVGWPFSAEDRPALSYGKQRISRYSQTFRIIYAFENFSNQASSTHKQVGVVKSREGLKEGGFFLLHPAHIIFTPFS